MGEESGEHVIAGCGELHVEICLKDLREEYAQCDFSISDPVVSYRETVGGESSVTVLAKSPNKHNRIYLKAEPMMEEVAKDIEDGKLGPKADPKERVKLFKEKYEWSDTEARKIWCWGPETDGPNVVVDTTQAVQYLLEIKEHVTSAFQWASKEGPLCEKHAGHPFQLDGCDTAHGFHPPWSRSNHATNEASMLRCRNDGKSHFAGTGVLGGNHMPTGRHEWCLFVHESASRMRFRGKSARRHTTNAGESLSARF